MPELPEVQTIVNDLQKITGDTITGFWTDFAKAVKTKGFGKNIGGKKISRIFRSGKNIVIGLDNGSSIVVHLKMTGQLLVMRHATYDMRQQEKYIKHVHHIFKLKNHGELRFSDIRKFGTLELVNEEKLQKMTSARGIDPFSKDFTFENFQKVLSEAKNKNVKQFLMDQAYVSGIGNIYASEIPFDSKIDPNRKNFSLNEAERKNLFISIKKILSKAIRFRGTSFSDYRDSEGKKGSFQGVLKVYGRHGQKCKACGTIVRKSTIGQRSTFACPKCQM